jgi:hypothetical protein
LLCFNSFSSKQWIICILTEEINENIFVFVCGFLFLNIFPLVLQAINKKSLPAPFVKFLKRLTISSSYACFFSDVFFFCELPFYVSFFSFRFA